MVPELDSRLENSEDWELELIAYTICFWYFRRICLLVFAGLLPAILNSQAPSLYRWFALGFACCTLLCWYLPSLGSSIVLAEEEPPLIHRKRLVATRAIIILSYLLPLILMIWVEKLGLVKAFSLLDRQGSISSLPFIGVSAGLSIYYLHRRVFYYRDKALELVDYRYIISYSLWAIFTLFIVLVSMFGRSP